MQRDDIDIEQTAQALNESMFNLRQIWARQEALRKAARFRPDGKLRKAGSRNRHIRSEALAVEPIGKRGAELWITYGGMRDTWLKMQADPLCSQFIREHCNPDALNGYVAFPKRHAPAVPVTTGGLVKYIPVHGGVTWAKKDAIAAVWGFDTGHAGSEKQPIIDRDWVRYQCHVLYHGLEVAEELWPQFRRERNEAKRAEIAQKVFECDPAQAGPFHERLGFEAMISLFFGGKV